MDRLTGISLFLICALSCADGFSQLPDCRDSTRHYIYYAVKKEIFMFDPGRPLSASNPRINSITLPDNSSGLALSANLNGSAPAMTFYTVVNGKYHYYNGHTWVNTGHATGHKAAINIGGGPHYIYNYVFGNGAIYRYDGKKNGQLLVTLPPQPGGGPFDLHVDNEDNFYVLWFSSVLNKYGPDGALQKSWRVDGIPDISERSGIGPGLAIIGNDIYFHVTRPAVFRQGYLGADTVYFTKTIGSGLPHQGGNDFATCPLAVVPYEVVSKVNHAAQFIFFETASAEIKPASFPKLDTIVGILKSNGTFTAHIEGHTDNVGKDAYNISLSERRARSVFEYLVRKGIDTSRLTSKGYGRTKPLAPNNTEAGRAKNRRIIITIGT